MLPLLGRCFCLRKQDESDIRSKCINTVLLGLLLQFRTKLGPALTSCNDRHSERPLVKAIVSCSRSLMMEGVIERRFGSLWQGLSPWKSPEAIGSIAAETPEFWRCQDDGTTTKDSSMCGVEWAWAYETSCLVLQTTNLKTWVLFRAQRIVNRS